MLIQTRNVIKTNHNDQLHAQHTTNAEYMKYLHLGYNILQGYKSVRYLNRYYYSWSFILITTQELFSNLNSSFIYLYKEFFFIFTSFPC